MQRKRKKKTDRGEQGKGDKREEGKTLDFIQLFRERLANKTVRDNAERYYG